MPEDNRRAPTVWEELEPGAEYGPYDDRVTPEDLFLWECIYGQPPGEAVPSGLMPIYVARAVRQAFRGISPDCVVVRETLQMEIPLRVGQALRATVRVVEKFLKHDDPHVVLVVTLRRPEGELIAASYETLIWPARGE